MIVVLVIWFAFAGSAGTMIGVVLMDSMLFWEDMT